MEKKISVIVPIYNAETYLIDCIESIINQTYNNLEFIFINDGSTDSSGLICDFYKNCDHRVKVIHKKNEGVGQTRNLGINYATGEYILFVDSDDLLDPKFIDTIVKDDFSDQMLTICNMYLYFEKNNIIKEIVKLENGNSVHYIRDYLKYFVLKYKTNPFIGSPCNKIFSKDILMKNNISFETNRNFAEDFLFNLEYLKYVDKVKIINTPLYTYRMDTEDSLTKDIKPAMYWWSNYKYIYMKYSELFSHYNLYDKHKSGINSFLELAVKDSLRKCFRIEKENSLSYKTHVITNIIEDELILDKINNFEGIDLYSKVIFFFSRKKEYTLLALILTLHSKLVDYYKMFKKNV